MLQPVGTAPDEHLPRWVILAVVAIIVVGRLIDSSLRARALPFRRPDRPLPDRKRHPWRWAMETLDPGGYAEEGRDLVRRRLVLSVVAFVLAVTAMLIPFVRAFSAP